MKIICKIICYIAFFAIYNNYSQNIKYVDSVNNLPFNIKQANKKNLIPIYKNNALFCKKNNLKLQEAICYSNLSWCYMFDGNFEKNLQYSLLAITIFESLKATEPLSREYGELGYRMNKRNLNEALYYMQKGKKIAEENNHKQPLLSIYNNYGALKQMQNQLDSALYYYKKCLKVKYELNDKLGIPYSLNNIGEVKMINKQYDEAEKMFQDALTIRKKHSDHYGISDSYAYLADLALTQKDYQTAINYYDKSLTIANQYNFNNLQRHNYLKLSEAYEKTDDNKNAYTSYKKHIQYRDSILNKETNSKIAELEVKFDTNQKEKIILQKEIENKRKSTWLIIISLLTLFTALIGFLFFRQQKLKNVQQEQQFQLKTAIAQIESQNKLQEQRLSISRDLHDNIGAQLTFIISSVENLKYGYPNIDEKIKSQLTKVGNFTRETIVELRDTIWAMNNHEFTIEDLRTRLANFIEKAKTASNTIDFKFSIEEALKTEKFTSVLGINLYRTIQEAVNNAIKYSNATSIVVNAEKNGTKTKITIQDNGKGFDLQTVDFGNGLHNMKKRIEEVQGTFEIESVVGKGTTIIVNY